MEGNDGRVVHDVYVIYVYIQLTAKKTKIVWMKLTNNVNEKPTIFKCKVRGPPWTLKIMKIQLKKTNEDHNNQNTECTYFLNSFRFTSILKRYTFNFLKLQL